ncbi:MAG: tetratricopeptide repeat protein [Pyrinomonadaceae bacterium]
MRKCLEKERRRRYQTAGELVKDLSEIKRDQGQLEPRTKRERRSPLAIGFGAAVLFALLLTVAALLYTPFHAVEVASIAVLPLTDLSGERADDYFADGMTVALINELGHVGELRVISPTSAMRYKDSQETLPQIARELNVDAIVEGTVLRSGARVRTAVKLTHASTGLQLWADSYERDARDVITMQQQVVRDIVGEIRVKLTPREQSRLTSARPINPEAHEAYLKGRQHLDKRNVEAIKTSIGYFNEAVAKDPGFALPQAALADAYFALGTVNLSALPPLEALERGRAAALRAIELDGTLAEGHTALAVIKFYSWEWAEAEEGFNRALELNPNYAPAHSWYAIYSAARGRLGGAIARIYRARDIDPLSPHIAQNAGWILHYARHYDEAIEQYQRALELDPNFLFARLRLAKVYSRKGMYDETTAQLARINTLPERTPAVLAELGYTYGVSGRKREAEQILKHLMEMREQKYVNPSHIANVHIGLGHKEQAFEWLEKAYREHSYGTVFLKMDTEFDPIRNDPRFTQLLQRVGLD